MTAKAMYDYLSKVSPDNDELLNISPQGIIVEKGLKNQVIHLGDDNSEERISFSDDPIMRVSLQWPNKTESDLGTILDFYYSTTKGNGRLESFIWRHPTDDYAYVIRFDCDASRQIRHTDLHGFVNIVFKVLGVLQSLVNSTYKWTLSGSGTSEYYCELAGGGDPSLTEPNDVWLNGTKATEATVGSLAAGQWDWGNNDALGYNTVYVRLTDSTDPDTKSDNYVEID